MQPQDLSIGNLSSWLDVWYICCNFWPSIHPFWPSRPDLLPLGLAFDWDPGSVGNEGSMFFRWIMGWLGCCWGWFLGSVLTKFLWRWFIQLAKNITSSSQIGWFHEDEDAGYLGSWTVEDLWAKKSCTVTSWESVKCCRLMAAYSNIIKYPQSQVFFFFSRFCFILSITSISDETMSIPCRCARHRQAFQASIVPRGAQTWWIGGLGEANKVKLQ